MAFDFNRRHFLTGLVLCPAIVKLDSIMPIKPIRDLAYLFGQDHTLFTHLVYDPKTKLVMRKTVREILANNTWLPYLVPHETTGTAEMTAEESWLQKGKLIHVQT